MKLNNVKKLIETGLIVFAGAVLFLSGTVVAGPAAEDRFPIVPAAHYAFTGQVYSLQSQHRPTVFAGTRQGREKLQELRRRNYRCQSTYRNWYRCRKIVEAALGSALKNRLAASFAQMGAIDFGSWRGANLLHKGTAYEQWQVTQSVAFARSNWDFYTQSIIDGGRLVKLELRNQQGQIEHNFLFSEAGTLTRVELVEDGDYLHLAGAVWSTSAE